LRALSRLASGATKERFRGLRNAVFTYCRLSVSLGVIAQRGEPVNVFDCVLSLGPHNKFVRGATTTTCHYLRLCVAVPSLGILDIRVAAQHIPIDMRLCDARIVLNEIAHIEIGNHFESYECRVFLRLGASSSILNVIS